MTASIYQPGDDIPLVNANSTLVPQNFTVSAVPTTVFNITAFSYIPGTGSLNIYINGVKQRLGIDFLETSNSSFTLLESPLIGDSITAEGFVGITVDIPDAEYLRLQLAASTGATMVGTSGYGFLNATTVEGNLQQIVDALGTTLALTAVQIQSGVAYITAGSSTAYTVNMTGMTVNPDTGFTQLELTAHATNTTTTPTLQPTGWTARAIKVFDTTGAKVNPAVGAIVAGAIYDFVFDGTNWICKSFLPQAATATTNASLLTSGTLAVARMATGTIVDRAYAEYTTSTALTSVIPFDDTIPQNTEGTQILSASITPKSISNRIRATFTGFGTINQNQFLVAALFNSISGVNAITAAANIVTNSGQSTVSTFIFEYVPGVTTTVSHTVRVGPGAASNLYMNSQAATRMFGGVARATLILEEIQA